MFHLDHLHHVNLATEQKDHAEISRLTLTLLLIIFLVRSNVSALTSLKNQRKHDQKQKDVNNCDGSNNSNVPLHSNLARSEVRETSPTTSSARNNILLRRSESVKT